MDNLTGNSPVGDDFENDALIDEFVACRAFADNLIDHGGDALIEEFEPCRAHADDFIDRVGNDDHTNDHSNDEHIFGL